jgi:hypothetical protein
MILNNAEQHHSEQPEKNDTEHALTETTSIPPQTPSATLETQYIRTNRLDQTTGYTNLIVKALIGVAILVMLIVAVYLYTNRPPKNNRIPVIKAENTPLKIRPPQNQNPAVPHQEKTIYTELDPNGRVPNTVENLLAEPEKPQPQSPSLPDEFVKSLGEQDGMVSEDKASSLTQSVPEPAPIDHSIDTPPIDHSMGPSITNSGSSLDQTEPTPKDSEPTIRGSEPSAVGNTPPLFSEETLSKENTPHDMEVAKINVKSSKITDKSSSTTEGSYRVQIYSALSQKDAEQKWVVFKKKASLLLAPYTPLIQRVDLGAEIGIRYRLQIGPFSKEKAKDVCLALKKQGIDCWVVRQ